MNHRRRAENALRRVLVPHYHKSDLFELLAIEFERVLRQVEREAYRHGVVVAANAVDDALERQGVSTPIESPIFEAVAALLEKKR